MGRLQATLLLGVRISRNYSVQSHCCIHPEIEFNYRHAGEQAVSVPASLGKGQLSSL